MFPAGSLGFRNMWLIRLIQLLKRAKLRKNLIAIIIIFLLPKAIVHYICNWLNTCAAQVA